MHYTIYTDGAYFPEHGVSAISYVMLKGKTKEEVRRMHQIVKGETCSRAELKAVISGIYVLPKDADSCTIVCDSRYAVDSCSGRCIRYSNLDLFKLYEDIVSAKGIDVSFSWVRSHNGNFYNEVCDSLCKQAVKEYCEKKGVSIN